jgi:hypothetical protein
MTLALPSDQLAGCVVSSFAARLRQNLRFDPVRAVHSGPRCGGAVHHIFSARRKPTPATPVSSASAATNPQMLSVGAGTGVKSVALALLPRPSAEPMITEFRTTAAPIGSSTLTANSTVPFPPGGRSGTGNVQTVAGRLPSGHDHPDVLAAALKVVWAGTVSVIMTPVAAVPPALLYLNM